MMFYKLLIIVDFNMCTNIINMANKMSSDKWYIVHIHCDNVIIIIIFNVGMAGGPCCVS